MHKKIQRRVLIEPFCSSLNSTFFVGRISRGGSKREFSGVASGIFLDISSAY